MTCPVKHLGRIMSDLQNAAKQVEAIRPQIHDAFITDQLRHGHNRAERAARYQQDFEDDCI